MRERYCVRLEHVCDERTGLEALLHRRACAPVVAGVAAGLHGSCLLCFGMTGSSKTHTMLGDKKGAGLIKLAARQLLASSAGQSVSFVQVLNGNRVFDLLPSAGTSSMRGHVLLPLPVGAAGPRNHLGLRRHPARCAHPLHVQPEDIRRMLRDGEASSELVPSTRRDVFRSRVAHDTRGAARPQQPERLQLQCVDLAGTERVQERRVSNRAAWRARAVSLSTVSPRAGRPRPQRWRQAHPLQGRPYAFASCLAGRISLGRGWWWWWRRRRRRYCVV